MTILAEEDIELLRREVMVLSARMVRAEERAEMATQVALSSIETQKNMVSVVDAAHTQMTEMVQTVRRLTGAIEMMAKVVLARDAHA